MSDTPTMVLGGIMPTRAGSVDPAKFPEEVFDLYSIPAFDRGEPEVVAGKEIGSAKQIVEPPPEVPGGPCGPAGPCAPGAPLLPLAPVAPAAPVQTKFVPEAET